ncbi:MAG: PIN domain-containing protein [Myxococcales bacterium]|nr:PIN domain-containing protein [Myxococcales bacterium]
MAVAALRENEPFHADALRRCMPLFLGSDEIVVPAIFEVEVLAALVRRGAAVASVSRFFDLHFANRTIVTIGPRAARAVRAVVGVTRLRAADALYVWVAAREGLPLVTGDQDVLDRALLAGVRGSAP